MEPGQALSFGTMLSLPAEIDSVPGKPIRDGWRGVVDFGEVWSDEDAELWPEQFGDELPVGKPLLYGCELAIQTPGRVTLRFLALDARRPVMQPGRTFTLREGLTPRATGHLLG